MWWWAKSRVECLFSPYGYLLLDCLFLKRHASWMKKNIRVANGEDLLSLVLDLDNLGLLLYLDCFQVVCIKLSHSVLKKKLNSSETTGPWTPLLISRVFPSKQIDLILEEKCNGYAFWSTATWWGLSLFGNGLYVVALFEWSKDCSLVSLLFIFHNCFYVLLVFLLLFLIIYFNQSTCGVFLTRSNGREERIWNWTKFNSIFLLFYLFQNGFEREAEHDCHPQFQAKLFYSSAR